MASNSFGNLFKITTWGESHGKSIGIVIDGCPAGIAIDEADINTELSRRSPGHSPYTSPRKEDDRAEILSGIFEGKTTGAPISIHIANKDADPGKYEPTKNLFKPGHANFTYLEKYGAFDYRGGGRASARETACRVAAGAIAKKFLAECGIHVTAFIKQIGDVTADVDLTDPKVVAAQTVKSPLFCPDTTATNKMIALLEEIKAQGDSIGGIVEFLATGLPAGLGDPVYAKLEATLAYAMLSIPASKGFEIGSGFSSISLRGSQHNDSFHKENGSIKTRTNFAGGTLGGISTGMPLVGRVAFKPASSITHSQETVTTSGEPAEFRLPSGSRHDPCVAIRAVPVVESMVAITLADAVLLNRSAKL